MLKTAIAGAVIGIGGWWLGGVIQNNLPASAPAWVKTDMGTAALIGAGGAIAGLAYHYFVR